MEDGCGLMKVWGTITRSYDGAVILVLTFFVVSRTTPQTHPQIRPTTLTNVLNSPLARRDAATLYRINTLNPRRRYLQAIEHAVVFITVVVWVAGLDVDVVVRMLYQESWLICLHVV